MASGNCLYQVTGTWENYLVSTYKCRGKNPLKKNKHLLGGGGGGGELFRYL